MPHPIDRLNVAVWLARDRTFSPSLTRNLAPCCYRPDFETLAKENDFQIWIERVADNDPIAVAIGDGSIASPVQAG